MVYSAPLVFITFLLMSCIHRPPDVHKFRTRNITFPILLEKNIRIDKIKENLYIGTDLQFYHSNVLISKMKDGTVVLASSPYESQGTLQMVKWIQSNLRPKQVVAVNTHFHADGTAGNSVYHKEGVETWASYQTAKLQMTEGKTILPLMLRNQPEHLQKRIKETGFEPAKNLFDAKKGKIFNFSGQEVQVYFPGEAHSPDNVVVYIPSQKVLFGGCMVKPKKLGWLKHANVKTWKRSAQNLLRFQVNHVIPGHGKWGDKSLLEKTVRVAEKAATIPGIEKKNFH